nr:MAG: hypothetical protein [Microvirus sp.]
MASTVPPQAARSGLDGDGEAAPPLWWPGAGPGLRLSLVP